MTLLFMDGFQDANVMPKPEWDGVFASVTTGRDGGVARGAVPGATRIATLSSAAATCIMGIAANLASLGNATNYWGFRDSAGTTQLAVFINSSGLIEVRRTNATGTLLGTSSGHAPITINSWVQIEAKVLLHTSAGSGRATIRLNGLQVLDVTATTSSLISSVYKIQVASATGANQVIYDDLYVCDAVDATSTQAHPNNDFLGDCRVAVLVPTAAGDTTGWTPSTGANYTDVDEIPVNTTDYVSKVATATGTRDLYNLTDPAGTIVTVFGIRTGLYVQKTDAGSALVKPVIKENSTVTSDATSQAPSATYGPIYGPLRAVRPSDSGAWTATNLTSLQAGVDVA